MIKYPRRFEQARSAGFDGPFDWDFLLPAWAPTNIEPMDLDGLVERYSRFLGFETKAEGVPIKRGQIITLEQLALTGFFTIIVMWAKQSQDIRWWEVWTKGREGVVKKRIHGNSQDLVRYVRQWFEWANMRKTGTLWTSQGVSPVTHKNGLTKLEADLIAQAEWTAKLLNE